MASPLSSAIELEIDRHGDTDHREERHEQHPVSSQWETCPLTRQSIIRCAQRQDEYAIGPVSIVQKPPLVSNFTSISVVRPLFDPLLSAIAGYEFVDDLVSFSSRVPGQQVPGYYTGHGPPAIFQQMDILASF